MKVLYFAWLRERIGQASEDVDPGEARNPAELIDVLRAKSEGHALAFEDTRAVRVAVDQKMADMTTPLGGASEVAFFPPVTGG